MENIAYVKNCYGCKMCLYSCGIKAVEESYDSEGFFYPRVNMEKCMNCGKCVSVCPSIRQNKNCRERTVYGVKNPNMEERFNATSGGFFEIIATHFIQSGGVVYAPTFDKGHKIVYIRIREKENVVKCRGSKYVQSDLTHHIYKRLLKDIDATRVLFVGTPCQCQGVKNIFPDKSGLFFLDFYCHGVPGPKVWEQYITHLIKNGSVKEYKFRDKMLGGWHESSISYIQKEKLFSKKIGDDKFSRWFFVKKMFRNSCFQCDFRTINRVGDITMGDFWGIETIDPKFDDDVGVSLVTINSEKGAEIWKAIRDLLEYKEYTESEVPSINFTKRKLGAKTKLYRKLYQIFPCYITFSVISGISKKSAIEKIIKGKKNTYEVH